MKTQEIPSEFGEKRIYYEDDRALERGAQRDHGVSLSRGIQNPPGCDPEQLALR